MKANLSAAATVFLLLMFMPVAARAQGQFVFNNRLPPEIDARFVLCTDPPGTSSLQGSEYHVQVLAGRDDVGFDPSKALVSVITDFRTGRAAGYVVPLLITVPGMGQPQEATVRVRAYQGATWENSPVQYEGIFMVQLDEAPGTPLYVAMGTTPLVLCDHSQPRPADELDHWTQTGTISTDLAAITFGKARFVAVGSHDESGSIFVSMDGHRWSQGESPTTNDLARVTFGAGLFVAVGEKGTILTSEDGLSWAVRNSGTTNHLWGLCYGAGEFIAAGDSGTIVASADGVGWERRTTGAVNGGDLRTVAYGDGVYLLSGGASLVSADGRLWSLIAGPYRDVAFANNQFITLFDYGIGISSFSFNGTHWEQRASYADLGFGISPRGSAYGDGKFVVVTGNSGTVAVSTNATVWQKLKAPTDSALSAVAYGNELFVAVGQRGALLTSKDGLLWQREGAGNSGWFLDAVYGGGKFVVVGAALTQEDGALVRRRIVSSPDGRNWTEARLANGPLVVETQPVLGVTYGAGRFVAVSERGSSSSQISTNGVDWVSSTGLPGGQDVTFGNGQFLSVGPDFSGLLGAGVSVSKDGLTWDRVLQNALADELASVTFGNGRFVAIGQNGAYMGLPGWYWQNPWELGSRWPYWNRNGIVFGAGTFVEVGDDGKVAQGKDYFQRVWSPTTNTLYNVAYGNGHFVAVGAAGTILSSSDAIKWLVRESGTTNDLYGVTFGNGRFLAVGANGTILQSPVPAYLQFSAIRVGQQGLEAEVSGDPGLPLRIEASENLLDWRVLQVLDRPADGVVTLEATPEAHLRRFYRVIVNGISH
jgi:hypothetical protein